MGGGLKNKHRSVGQLLNLFTCYIIIFALIVYQCHDQLNFCKKIPRKLISLRSTVTE